MNARLGEIAEISNPNDTLLVWIDISAIHEDDDSYCLPGNPSWYSIKWALITYSPKIRENNLFWCLAEVEVQKIATLFNIPWVRGVDPIRIGNLTELTLTNSKLPLGFHEVKDRVMNCNESIQVVVLLQNLPDCYECPGNSSQNIMYETVRNVTADIEQFGGFLPRNYYRGCHSLLADLPIENLTALVENPRVKKLYFNGPLVPDERYDAEMPLSNLYGTITGTSYCWYALTVFQPIIVPKILLKRTRTKILVLLLSSAILFAFAYHYVPSVKALNVGTATIRATDVWTTGNRGAGVNVVIIDLGFDVNHNDLASAIIHTYNTFNDGEDVSGGFEWHGTHVAGIVAGRGINNAIYTGVAPEAGLILIKVADDHSVEEAIRWAIDHKNQYNIRVITSSIHIERQDVPLGGDGLEFGASIAMDDATENGIITVNAAGNNGSLPRTIGCPGNAFNIITVGAIDDGNSESINNDILCSDSSRGPTADGRSKIDLVAPGENIISAKNGTQSYISADGTSFAAPFVAGTLALMLHVNSGLTPAQARGILRQTARLNSHLSQLTVADRGYGIIDAYEAVQLAQNIDNLQKDKMFETWTNGTSARQVNGWTWDAVNFTIEASQNYGFGLGSTTYYWWNSLGQSGEAKILSKAHVKEMTIDNVPYDLAEESHKYLLSGPRMFQRGADYVSLRATYKAGSFLVNCTWHILIDSITIQVNSNSSSSLTALVYFDIDDRDTTNYAYMPSTSETILTEGKITGNQPVTVRDFDCTQHIQIDTGGIDSEKWILKHGYFGSNPDDFSAMNTEYIYNRNVAVYVRQNSQTPYINLSRSESSLPAPDPTQNDAGQECDASNLFDQATQINPGTYFGILCNADPEDTQDYYRFYVQNGQYIYGRMTPPAGIDFGLELWDPTCNRRWYSLAPAGCTESFFYLADSTGEWRGRIVLYSGEGEYEFSVSVVSDAYGMKTSTNGYFYVPSVSPSLIYVDRLFDNANLTGDQAGRQFYGYSFPFPDGIVDIFDISFIAGKFGLAEGQSGWDYMADVVPDRVIDIFDIVATGFNNGKTGEYDNWILGVIITFNTPNGNVSRIVGEDGFVEIPQGATVFTIKNGEALTGAMIILWSP
jgi:serine protease AprX